MKIIEITKWKKITPCVHRVKCVIFTKPSSILMAVTCCSLCNEINRKKKRNRITESRMWFAQVKLTVWVQMYGKLISSAPLKMPFAKCFAQPLFSSDLSSSLVKSLCINVSLPVQLIYRIHIHFRNADVVYIATDTFFFVYIHQDWFHSFREVLELKMNAIDVLAISPLRILT